MLAYLDMSSVSKGRNDLIKPKYFKRVNNPGYAIRVRRLRKIQPANKAEDPYIATVPIALAQEQQLQRDEDAVNDQQTSVESTGRFKVHVLALSDHKVPTLYFYNAHIPSMFLDRLDSPSLHIPSKPFRIS